MREKKHESTPYFSIFPVHLIPCTSKVPFRPTLDPRERKAVFSFRMRLISRDTGEGTRDESKRLFGLKKKKRKVGSRLQKEEGSGGQLNTCKSTFLVD